MNTYQSNFNVIYYDIRLFEHFDFSQNTVHSGFVFLLIICQTSFASRFEIYGVKDILQTSRRVKKHVVFIR